MAVSFLSLQSLRQGDQPGMCSQDCLQMEAVGHDHPGLPEVATRLDGADGLVQRQVACCLRRLSTDWVLPIGKTECLAAPSSVMPKQTSLPDCGVLLKAVCCMSLHAPCLVQPRIFHQNHPCWFHSALYADVAIRPAPVLVKLRCIETSAQMLQKLWSHCHM